MPDKDVADKGNPRGGQQRDNEAFQKFIADLADKKVEPNLAPPKSDSFQRPVFLGKGEECFRCHPKKDKDSNLNLDLGRGFDFAKFDRFAPKQAPETPEAKEQRIQRDFEKSEAHEKLLTVFNRLPEKAAVTIGKDSLSLKTDFVGAIEAVPGAKLDDVAKKALSSLKSLDLNKDKFTADFGAETRIPINKEVTGLGNVKELKLSDANGKLGFDLKLNGKDALMQNISGLKMVLEDGKEVAIRSLSINTSGDKPTISLKIDNPKTKPDRYPAALWPDTIPTPAIPLERVLPGLDPALVRSILGACSEARGVFKDKNFAPYTAAIPEQGLRETVDKILSGAQSIEKNGNRLTIKRDNGEVTHDLGGAKLKIDSRVDFSIGSDAKAPSIYDISGVKVSVPMPAELRLGTAVESVKEVSLGHVARDGSRDFSLRMGPLVDNLRLRLDGQMQPVKDGQGNWNVNLRVANLLSNTPGDKVSMRLRIGADGNLNMKASEILDIVSAATGQAADLSLSGAAKAVISLESKVIGTAAWLLGY